MSDDHGAPETSHSNYVLSVVGAIGSMLLFGLIIFIAYIPNRPTSANTEIVQQRMTNLEEMKAAQSDAADNYSWVDKQAGVVRIPISQAMELTAQRLGEGEAAFTVPEPEAETGKAAVSKSSAGPASKGGTVAVKSGTEGEATDASATEGTAASKTEEATAETAAPVSESNDGEAKQ